MLFQSLPLWERGLKSVAEILIFIFLHVAPLVGAWIEIAGFPQSEIRYFVAPLVGAWIEMYEFNILINCFTSRSPCGSVD